MSNDENSRLELPADLAAFADDLRKALDVGIAQLDAGESTRSTPREMMDGIRADIGLKRTS